MVTDISATSDKQNIIFSYSTHTAFVFVFMYTLTFALAFTSGCCVDDSSIFTIS